MCFKKLNLGVLVTQQEVTDTRLPKEGSYS